MSSPSTTMTAAKSTLSAAAPLRLCCIQWNANKPLGLHLSRAPWDPYPWISDVFPGSTAYDAGIRSGDCVLEVNGEDILGKRIAEVAIKIKQNSDSGENGVTLLLWNAGTEQNISPHLLKKFSTILQSMGQLLECPICFDIVKPPAWQCCHGHILCGPCRMRSVRCPVCRVQLGRRGRCLIADKLYNHLMEDKMAADDPQLETSKDAITIATRFQPLRETSYCSIFKDIFTKKKSRKQFLHQSHHKLSQLEDKPNKLYCPTGKSCPFVTTQAELFTHLFQSHNLPVTQYYCHPGDAVKVKFRESSIPCITFMHARPPGSDEPQLQPCQFFIVKYFKYPNEILCWIWYFGKMLNEFKYRVKMKNREKGICWIGDPVPMSTCVDDVLKSKEVAWLDQSVKYIYIQICKTSSNANCNNITV